LDFTVLIAIPAGEGSDLKAVLAAALGSPTDNSCVDVASTTSTSSTTSTTTSTTTQPIP